VQRHFRVQFPQIFTKHKRSEDEILRILGGDFLTMDLGAAESRYRETMLTHLKEMSPGDEFKKTFGRYVSNPVLFDPMVRMTLQADRDLLMQSVMTGYNWIFSPSETVAGLNRYKQEVLRAYTVAGSFGNPYVPAP
jgi:hypothetical protein